MPEESRCDRPEQRHAHKAGVIDLSKDTLTSDDVLRSNADFPPAFSTSARAASSDAIALDAGSSLSRSTDTCLEDLALLLFESKILP